MENIATVKLGFIIAVVMLGALSVAFLGYMTIFGRKSTVRQKSAVEIDKSA
jgi:hypothetical protein